MLAIEVAEKLYKGRLPQGIPMEQRDFQDEAVAKLIKYPKHILGLPMGAGKTLVSLKALKQWAPRRSLIIPTERAILAWLKAMWIWYPEMLEQYCIISSGYKKDVRQRFWRNNAKHPNLNVITNFQLATRDKDFIPKEFDAVITDEYHKFMRNRNTLMHKFMKSLRTDAMLFVSGSPASKGAQDFYATLNCLDPVLFSSYWKFVKTWCYVDEGPYGKTVRGTRNPEQFRKVMHTYGILKTKKQLGLQKKVRDILRIEMDPEQSAAYESISEEFLLELEDGPPVVLLNTLHQYIKLRQILSCPAILSPTLGIGGGAKFITDTLLDLPLSERHSVVFTPFKGGLPYLEAYFQGKGRTVGLPEDGIPLGVPVYTFYGGMGIQALFDNLHAFKQNGGLAICTTQFAESFDMETTDKAFMLGYDWDPQVNFQAEDRLDRLDNKHGLINIYYLLHEHTIDDDILYSLILKQTNINQIFSNRVILQDALKSNC